LKESLLFLMNRFRIFHLLSAGLFFGVSVTLQGAPLPSPPSDSFTIAVLPDTQNYIGKGTKRTPDSTKPVTNAVFVSHLDWIVANKDRQGIVFVSHVGDIVDRNVPAEWATARHELDRLHGLVPFALTVGNHDMMDDGNASLFQGHFPAAVFEKYPWYLESFAPKDPSRQISGNNSNSSQLFTAGDSNFVHLSLECNAPDDVVAWADGILTRYADRIAIITTHMDLGPLEHPQNNEAFIHAPKGRMRWSKRHGDRGNTSQQLWDKLYCKHENLLLIFSGDQSRSVAMHLETKGDHGNTVHALLSDYGSAGPMRLYRFLPSEHRIDVITYDTVKSELVSTQRYVPERSRHQFSIPWGTK